ncbi:hypothetical protein I302_101584 [Kwoniella bestiolae CBS 10118]|uniref:Zn(2)-C6 fungal-type domain-containing protein n=1 Tax=Kwoniella bestiolae CBS 10118 TaxID=1296100 RepID=A0A1B9GCQ0_9TREE|nr:hypothetical protein I302_00266 [Kwoniella bestiolae CBS 10118]OCF28777.1 hypothetical protein I302_00266 [Kwoniella bestiolae CBS 10118]
MNLPSFTLSESSTSNKMSPEHPHHPHHPHTVRRESFHYSGERPHPPPLKSTYSFVGPSSSASTSNLLLRTPQELERKHDWQTSPGKQTSPNQNQNQEKPTEKEELTTKGRKRKRLAKACSACHKNKRRCDGFAPCSNCEFSNRPCLYLNAQGDPIPPPRTRDSSAVPARPNKDDKQSSNAHERKTSGESNWSRRESFKEDAEHHRRPSLGPIQAVEHDTTLGAELIDIFFRRCAPLSTMLHAPTFHYRLYMNQVSPILLDIIYAFSSRLCENPTFVSTFSPSQPAHLRGEAFIHRAHGAAQRMIEVRKTWNEEERRMDRGTWQETELAQACYLLSVYFSCLRQPKIGMFYLDSGLDILRSPDLEYIPPPATHLSLNPVEYNTLMEIRIRTFWLLVFHDLCAAANGRPRRFTESDLGNTPLPSNESHWNRWGGNAVGGREPGRRDGLVPGSGNWPGEDGQIGELGHVLRILSIFADIMTLATDSKTDRSEPKQNLASRYESALKSWAMNLPRHLHFDEHNLSSAVNRLASPVAEIKMTGWMYAYMHAVAECGMFYLQAAVAQFTDGAYTAQRQSQAVDNLTVIMDSIGRNGREGCCFLFPLFVISNWQEHLKMSNLVVPGPQQAIMEDRLSLWWNEMRAEWGTERHDLLQRGFYSLNTNGTGPTPTALATPRFSQSQPTIELPASGLGLSLYQTSPVRQMTTETASAISATSPVSTMSISTPHMSTYSRFSISGSSAPPTLPPLPLRPRAQSSAATMSVSYTSPSPPIGSRILPGMIKSSSSGRSDLISLPPLSSEFKSNLKITSPRHHPYARSPRMSWAGPTITTSSNTSTINGNGKSPRKESSNHLMGIAALVSVAENEREERERERQREREKERRTLTTV